ncbi:origin recognition complex subunit [Magnaporthiopsis poae ATCC 64411]|uniref:Origin recognition complex subunit n=1 Tax=Magnaporthiopsis poae (strain ATCC 64411 / 73-15) TaxID=644358 RepID=A0A0C4DTF9_MAGP6|nr:origin recognition complex subunit [Magnaporthiopsis poae ATCC 64411]
MASVVSEDDHQAAYIFTPSDERGPEGAAAISFAAARPSKKRKLVASGNKSRPAARGRNGPATSAGSGRDSRPTAATASFAYAQRSKIPAAFIVTGPDLSSQDLLFSQLSERLAEAEPARFVRVNSAEATNLKSALKKIIRDVTCRPSADDATPSDETLVHPPRKYLDYDLEALHVFLRARGSRRVFVAFEDSEALDSGLLSDLITLFASWRDRIHFTLLFRIGTSVELFQARLPRSTYQHLHGCQFDVTHASTITEKILRACLSQAAARGILLGPDFLAAQLERQRDQVAGIQMLISSIKLAYMCHFYANPLSFLLVDSGYDEVWEGLMQDEHWDAVRHTASFRAEVESAIDIGNRLDHVRALLEDDNYIGHEIRDQMANYWHYWAPKLDRSLGLLVDSGMAPAGFTSLYMHAVSDGLDLSAKAVGVVDGIRRMNSARLAAVVENMISLIGPEPACGGDNDVFRRLYSTLEVVLDDIRNLEERALASGTTLRSKYHTQSRALRTTVVAQKVQLSRDTAALSEDDKAFSKLVDRLTDALTEHLACEAPREFFLHEAWLYDYESPHQDIFVPAPGAALERALSRPHDYLACSCCSTTPAGGLASTMPATSILYHLYKEAGLLVNVADLWTAFSAMVVTDDSAAGDDDGSDGRKRGGGGTEGCDERTALMLFYRGLAELRSMGFVQPTRKKEDHIAKVKWL